MTPSTKISAVTPTITPPVAMTVINDSRRDERRLRRYRNAIRASSRDGQFARMNAATATRSTAPTPTRMMSRRVIRAAAWETG